eukprot:TRINITY_DN10962_c0_g1_i1.p1 TRINITY_DN10962_c0_g1~~TRINITY_DN10962_c0_g1_i1.p1  ORF type:complete len:638 (+),score=209.17 TRINITY_DN10962_c0_g1_i1:120-2033(+)
MWAPTNFPIGRSSTSSAGWSQRQPRQKSRGKGSTSGPERRGKGSGRGFDSGSGAGFVHARKRPRSQTPSEPEPEQRPEQSKGSRAHSGKGRAKGKSAAKGSKGRRRGGRRLRERAEAKAAEVAKSSSSSLQEASDSASDSTSVLSLSRTEDTVIRLRRLCQGPQFCRELATHDDSDEIARLFASAFKAALYSQESGGPVTIEQFKAAWPHLRDDSSRLFEAMEAVEVQLTNRFLEVGATDLSEESQAEAEDDEVKLKWAETDGEEEEEHITEVGPCDLPYSEDLAEQQVEEQQVEEEQMVEEERQVEEKEEEVEQEEAEPQEEPQEEQEVQVENDGDAQPDAAEAAEAAVAAAEEAVQAFQEAPGESSDVEAEDATAKVSAAQELLGRAMAQHHQRAKEAPGTEEALESQREYLSVVVALQKRLQKAKVQLESHSSSSEIKVAVPATEAAPPPTLVPPRPPPPPASGQAGASTAAPPEPKECRFGWLCKRTTCAFSHSQGREIDVDPQKGLCRFGDACMRPDCFYRHEKPAAAAPKQVEAAPSVQPTPAGSNATEKQAIQDKTPSLEMDWEAAWKGASVSRAKTRREVPFPAPVATVHLQAGVLSSCASQAAEDLSWEDAWSLASRREGWRKQALVC